MFGLGIVTKLPRVTIGFFLFITIFLLTFLFIGCTSPSSSFSSVYVIQYQYNQNSTLYSNVENEYNGKNLSGYSTMQIRAGYLSVCALNDNNSPTCASKSNLSALQNYNQGIDMYNSTSIQASIAAVDPLQLAQSFSNNIINPYFVLISLFFTVVGFVSTIWTGTSFLPQHKVMHQVWLYSIGLGWLFWVIGGIWLRVAANASVQTIQQSSFTLLQAEMGSRASAMGWTAFAFLTLSVIGGISLQYKHRLNVDDAKV